MTYKIDNSDINARTPHLDTELARTFLAVISAGSFIDAAELLNVTQSTVSARIQNLEQQLGCALFVRNKAGVSLTPSGRQFQKHAATLVRTVELARSDVGVPRGFRAAISIGGRFGLWEQLLIKWLPTMRASAPDISLRAEIGFEADLMQGLMEGRIDIGVMYAPQSRPGLVVEQLLEDRLVLVSTNPESSAIPSGDYVYNDWGPEFYARHSASYPDYTGAALTANIGWLGLQHILSNGGSGYFPARLVEPHIANGKLHHIRGALEFSLPAYLVSYAEADKETIGFALDSLRHYARKYSFS